jgi:hypothetical protein
VPKNFDHKFSIAQFVNQNFSIAQISNQMFWATNEFFWAWKFFFVIIALMVEIKPLLIK